MQEKFRSLFQLWAKEEAASIEKISAHGSNRVYYRIKGATQSCLGAFNADIRENEAFFSFTENFLTKNLPVPKIYSIDTTRQYYLLEDLGDTTLFHYLSGKSSQERFNAETLTFYEKIIEHLIHFQLDGNEVMGYSKCYPRNVFDEQCMSWDLNYFKYCFLKLANIPFDEQDLETDFQVFISFLKKAAPDYFMFRDFQSRNIMLKDENFYFIDYQGGRKGPLQYDLASLLFDGKAEMPNTVRKHLLEIYIRKISERISIDQEEFSGLFYGFVFMRIMQAFGTYGYRGIYENKVHFLKSIAPALQNLSWLIENVELPVHLPVLQNIWKEMCSKKMLNRFIPGEKEENFDEGLTVSVYSFSYKKKLPIDFSGNGGGFLFDCRALPNPGREVRFRTQTGKDAEVIDFLEKEKTVEEFLSNSFSLIEISIKNYLERGFSHLLVGYGCTGGQHRSVYCAEQLAAYLKKHYSLKINLRHLEQGDI